MKGSDSHIKSKLSQSIIFLQASKFLYAKLVLQILNEGLSSVQLNYIKGNRWLSNFGTLIKKGLCDSYISYALSSFPSFLLPLLLARVEVFWTMTFAAHMFLSWADSDSPSFLT